MPLPENYQAEKSEMVVYRIVNKKPKQIAVANSHKLKVVEVGPIVA